MKIFKPPSFFCHSKMAVHLTNLYKMAQKCAPFPYLRDVIFEGPLICRTVPPVMLSRTLKIIPSNSCSKLFFRSQHSAGSMETVGGVSAHSSTGDTLTLTTTDSHMSNQTPSCRALAGSLASFDTSSIVNTEGMLDHSYMQIAQKILYRRNGLA